MERVSSRSVRPVACLLALFLVGAAPASTSPSAKPAVSEVKIENFTFTPATITIAAGTTVTWTNVDDIPHTVTAEDHSFRSKALDTNDRFTFTFTKPGEYSYFCSLHPRMVGKVVVK
ncbi:cupredoxin domain-containing protein [Microvirga sp. 2MCAF38]|uniref:cupredoxin domain-containing protein n=1 Tax=Microvirga sp. 2MCAF38 TaxID=3232989 RepID=UPI003F9B9A26